MILLDTHTFVWLASSPDQLSAPAYEVVEANLGQLAVSIVSAWEIALLVRKERLHLPLQVHTFIERALEHHGITELPLTRSVIFDAVNLQAIHNDPFDRILIAEAKRRECALVTKDRVMPQYGVPVVW